MDGSVERRFANARIRMHRVGLHATTQISPALLGRYLLVKHHYAFVGRVGRPDRESIVLNPTRTSLDRRRSNCQAGSLWSLIGLEYLSRIISRNDVTRLTSLGSRLLINRSDPDRGLSLHIISLHFFSIHPERERVN